MVALTGALFLRLGSLLVGFLLVQIAGTLGRDLCHHLGILERARSGFVTRRDLAQARTAANMPILPPPSAQIDADEVRLYPPFELLHRRLVAIVELDPPSQHLARELLLGPQVRRCRPDVLELGRPQRSQPLLRQLEPVPRV